MIAAIAESGDYSDPKLDPFYEDAISDTIKEFEATGAPIITDEQRKYHNFWTYSVHGLHNAAPDGFKIPLSAGHVRLMPRLTGARFATKSTPIAILMWQSLRTAWIGCRSTLGLSVSSITAVFTLS